MAGEKAPTAEQTDDNQGPSRPLSLLAGEMFGPSYHGEVPAADEDEEQPVEEAGEDEAEDGESGDEPEAGDDADGEIEPEAQDDEQDDADDDEATVQTVQELIEAQEWDPDWFNGLKVPVKIDGEQADATIADLVKSYQMGEAATKRLEDAKARAKTIVEEAAQQQEGIQEQFVVAAKLIERAEKALDDDAAIDWQALRESDPGEYSAKKTEIAERRRAIEDLKREASADYQKAIQEASAQNETQMREVLQKEQEQLLEKLPEWRDAEKAKTEKRSLAEYLVGQGFEQQDVASVADHRLLLLARKAWLYDQGRPKETAAKKKLAKVPKAMKPGAPKPQEQIDRQRIDRARDRLRKSGSLDDAFAVLQARKGR